MKTFQNIDNIRDIRKKLGLNQQEFWSQIGVTQSGGSRYESGRNMPKPVRELLRLVHVEQVDLAKVNHDDMVIAALLNSALKLSKEPNLASIAFARFSEGTLPFTGVSDRK